MADPKQLPPLSVLEEIFVYEPDSGFIRYRGNGTLAGSRHKVTGYIGISVAGYGSFPAHRIAWKMYYKSEPPRKLDHKDRIKHHNWITNLRPATSSDQIANRKLEGRSKSGHKNITITSTRIYVRISHKNAPNGKGIQKGFENSDQGLSMAIEWRDNKLKEFHGEFYCE